MYVITGGLLKRDFPQKNVSMFVRKTNKRFDENEDNKYKLVSTSWEFVFHKNQLLFFSFFSNQNESKYDNRNARERVGGIYSQIDTNTFMHLANVDRPRK